MGGGAPVEGHLDVGREHRYEEHGRHGRAETPCPGQGDGGSARQLDEPARQRPGPCRAGGRVRDDGVVEAGDGEVGHAGDAEEPGEAEGGGGGAKEGRQRGKGHQPAVSGIPSDRWSDLDRIIGNGCRAVAYRNCVDWAPWIPSWRSTSAAPSWPPALWAW